LWPAGRRQKGLERAGPGPQVFLFILTAQRVFLQGGEIGLKLYFAAFYEESLLCLLAVLIPSAAHPVFALDLAAIEAGFLRHFSDYCTVTKWSAMWIFLEEKSTRQRWLCSIPIREML
jgi:hypothetical protein